MAVQINSGRVANLYQKVNQSSFSRGIKSWMGTKAHREGAKWAKDFYGLSKGTKPLFRVLGLGFLAYDAYSGYKEGGLTGAASSVAQGFAFNYALGVGKSVLGSALTGAAYVAPFAIGGAIMFRRQLAQPYVREFARKRARLEMSMPIEDQFGTISTMRQRSLMMMRQSKLNARTSLGQEATYAFKPYFR